MMIDIKIETLLAKEWHERRKSMKSIKKAHVSAMSAFMILAMFMSLVLVLSGCANSQDVVSSDANSTADEVQSDTNTSSVSEETESQQEQSSISKDVFSATKAEAQTILDTLTLEQKIGQLFISRCPETESSAIAAIETLQPAGYILFARDIDGKTAQKVKETLQSYQNASNVPMIFGVDEEGGTVVRVSSNPLIADHKFQSPQTVYAQGGISAIVEDTKEKSQLLLSLGIHLNLAPVADVSFQETDFIYDRTFGQDAESTADYISTVVTTMNEEGISSTLKHFPGYGNNEDTHTGIAYDNRPMSTFESSDFLPFLAGIKAGAPAVLVSHNIVNCMDSGAPASLSKEVHRILREELEFTGVIMTDDLAMEAIPSYTGGQDPSVMAFQAGNDILLTSDLEGGVAAIKQAVTDGTITEQEINERVLRVLAWKLQYR